MWWVPLVAIAWLLLGVITFYPYGHMIYKTETDQTMDYGDWFYDLVTPKQYLLYVVFWPFFFSVELFSYVKFLFHDRYGK